MSQSDDYLRLAGPLESLEALQLRRPFAIVGFGGWIDAGLAATGAVKYLVEHLSAQPIAELDPETFYSFTDTRPRVVLREPGQRDAHWPRTEWFAVRMPDEATRDLILFTGPEPNLRWRTFTSVVLDVFQRLGTETLVSFGAVLAPIHYRARPGLRGWGTTPALRAQLRKRHIRSGNYQGPTGITTVLLTSARERGLAAFSLSTSSPSYLPEMNNPRASATLLQGAADIGGVNLSLDALEDDARGYVERVDQFLVEQPELREAVERLGYDEDEDEDEHDRPQPASSQETDPTPGELPSSAAVLRDLEEFLKNLRQDP